jgi:hypothetical protein
VTPPPPGGPAGPWGGPEDRRRLVRTLVPLFAVLLLAVILRHEMWRDELGEWLLAKDAPSLPGLLFSATAGTRP